jgi:type IV pilus assembly protein PilM
VSGGSSPTVTAVGYAPLVPGAVNEGEVLDPDSVAAAVKQAWRKTGLGRDVVLGLSGRHVIVRQMELPWLEDKEFRQALPYRVAGQLPVPVEDVILDYIVLGDAETKDAGGGRMMSLLLVAAMRQPVQRAIQAVQKAGLRPVRVDLSGLALLRIADGGPMPAGVAEARVDIGAEVTTVVVVVDGIPRFVRMLAGEGGLKLTRALVERFDLTVAEAEDVKRRLGTSTGVNEVNVEDREIRSVIDKVTDSTLTAVRSSLDFYLGNAPDVQGLGRVVLTGGGAHLFGLTHRLSDALEIPVVLVDPLSGLSVSRKAADATAALSPALGVAAGLGLAEVA